MKQTVLRWVRELKFSGQCLGTNVQSSLCPDFTRALSLELWSRDGRHMAFMKFSDLFILEVAVRQFKLCGPGSHTLSSVTLSCDHSTKSSLIEA